MRKIKLEDWLARAPATTSPIPRSKKMRRRPTPDWKLRDSIEYIRMRGEYLQREGILVKIGERRWRLNPKMENRE